MALKDLFHDFLDGEWPLWKEPKNNGGVKYQQLYRAFLAGYKLSDEGIPAERFVEHGSMSILEAMTLPPQKFKPGKVFKKRPAKRS